MPRQFSRLTGVDSGKDLTALLVAWAAGDDAAAHEVLPMVYEELRLRARYFMANEPAGHILQTSALINEAYLRLHGPGRRAPWRDRGHFFAVACRAMRHILVDIARKERNQKRGGQFRRVEFSEGFAVGIDRPERLIALHDALATLASADPRKAHVVEMRFFGGLNVSEIATALDVSPETVKRDWKFAKAWLGREIRRSAGDDD